ncbi:MAG TPA: DUF1259 domain-containing protein [Stenomitos sp.]
MSNRRLALTLALAGTIMLSACGRVEAKGNVTPFQVAAAASGLDTSRIELLTGYKGTLNQKEGVFKVNAPRTDLQVTIAGVKMTPSMGLTSWASFQKAGARTMVMGDMVMTEDQVNTVMSVALDNGLEVTGLHDHFLWDSPRVMFMHLAGLGSEEQLAGAVGKVLAKIRATSGGRGETPTANLSPANTTLDPKTIEGVLGEKGELSNGVYKVTLGRTTTMHGVQVGNTMGVNTWAAFVGSDAQAVVDGDFVMHEDELQGVLKALRGAGINIVAIHNHMVGESPRMMFLHYWGVGSTTDLAKGLRAALDVTQR